MREQTKNFPRVQVDHFHRSLSLVDVNHCISEVASKFVGSRYISCLQFNEVLIETSNLDTPVKNSNEQALCQAKRNEMIKPGLKNPQSSKMQSYYNIIR